MILEQDTLYYRHDHPNGFMFSAGNEEPGDGWYAAPEQIPEEAEPQYECSNLQAFSALLRSERQAAEKQARELEQATRALTVAAVQRDTLFAEIARLHDEIAALKAEEGA